MSIIYDEKSQVITLHTQNTTYQMKVGKYGFLLHLYYGKRIEGDMSYLLDYSNRAFSVTPNEAGAEQTFFPDVLPQEYSCYGNGDFRTASFNMKNCEGVYGCDLRYRSHEIKKGKYSIPGLPAVYAEAPEGETLEVVLADQNAGVEITLHYGVLEKLDVITRAISVKNIAGSDIVITKAGSGMLDFLYGDYDILHFHGRHGMERNLERTPVMAGNQAFKSLRGISGHQHNPFVILAEKGTNEECGSCYGMSLLYSGNFTCESEKDQFNQTRISMGVQTEMFEYTLSPGAVFHTPEIACIYSPNGLTDLSQKYHKMIRENVCRGIHKNVRRPIVINNWEATYFDFNGEKIIDMARQAAELGVEMFVLDDGWFGKRDDDDSGLGDWVVDEAKLGMPLAELAEKINGFGMKFGLWFEPEMVSEDSDLYRRHPDWALAIPGRRPFRGRRQLVLDFSRKEIVDNIFRQISAVLESANIEYVKLDMNRSIMDVYTLAEGCQNHGTIMYQYVLGVYDFLERLIKRFPNLLIEGCCGGGGRFDAGMLYYTPQIWCSDNTDAIERLKIQHGTSFGYPAAAVGAHVSAVPNHQTGRRTNIKTRGIVAMTGAFGYELDLNIITAEEKEAVREQIQDYKKYWHLTHQGLYYRLSNAMEDTEFTAWEFISEDQKEALLNVVTIDTHCNAPLSYVKLKGLNPNGWYRFSEEDRLYSGTALMNGGLPIPRMSDEYQAWQLHLMQV